MFAECIGIVRFRRLQHLINNEPKKVVAQFKLPKGRGQVPKKVANMTRSDHVGAAKGVIAVGEGSDEQDVSTLMRTTIHAPVVFDA